MCGIAGIYGLEQLENPETLVKKMADALAHRGPNAEGYYRGRNVMLGHRRLSIIDLSDAANQPFLSSDGRYALIYNGELYNFKSIKAELSHYPFKTSGDTEVVLAALMEWGSAALQKFNGMFAIAFWDNQEERLLLARDRVGIKPLYYSQTKQHLVFASEVRSILSTNLIERRIDQESLVDYLRYQTVHAPRTILKGVKMLRAGHVMEIADNEVSERPYWKPWQVQHSDRDLAVIQKEIRDRLTASVERRLISDVPFGAFLSGGIDSSLLVGIIAERLGHSIDTFNVSFDESEFSEAHYARSVAQKFGTNHHEILLNPSDFMSALPTALSNMDHPSGDGPNTWIVSRETKRQGITMALSGLGGDELFAGYDVFKRIPQIADRNWILSFPKPIRALVGQILEWLRPGMASAKTSEILTSDYFDLVHLYPTIRKVLMDERVRRLMPSERSKNVVTEMLQELERFKEFGGLPTLSRISVVEVETYMQHVLLRDSDQMSMAHALEVRVPFLDHTLVEYAMHVPDRLKYPHSPKELLVQSFSDLLPREIVHRPKMGFVLPWDGWMRKELKDYCEEGIQLIMDSNYLEADAVANLWKDFLARKPTITWSRVWPLVTLGQWMRMNDVE